MSRRGYRTSRRMFAAGGSDGGSFLPTQIAGLQAWYRADLGITIGTGVSAWADQSGNGDANRNLTQATGANQPTRNAADASYGGKPTLSFNGTTMSMASGAWSVAPPETAATVFIVGNNDNGAVQEVFLDSISAARYVIDNASTAGDLRYLLTSGVIATGLSLNNPSVMWFKILAGSVASAAYVNALTAKVTGSPGGASGATGITIGAAFGGASAFLNGKIAELIIYNSDIGSSGQAIVANYLGARYGIAIGP